MNLSLSAAIQIQLTFSSSKSIITFVCGKYRQKQVDEWNNHRQ